MSKPTAVVVVEGTLFDQMDSDLMIVGMPILGIQEKLADLQKTHYVLLVSSFTRTLAGTRILTARLYEEAIPFDEIWLGCGVPVGAVRYDNAAQTL